MDGELLEAAKRALSKYPLCDRCLGRLFAGLGRGLTNAERGRALKVAILMDLAARMAAGDQGAAKELEALAPNMGPVAAQTYKALTSRDLEPRQCYICGGALDDFIRAAAERACESLRRYGARTFLIGVSVSPDVVSREEEVKSYVRAGLGESLAREIKREVGKLVQQTCGYVADFAAPDVIVNFSYPDGRQWLQVRRVTLGVIYRRWDRERPYRAYETSPLLERIRGAYGASRASIVGLVRDEKGARVLGLGVPAVIVLKGATARDALKPGDRVEEGGASVDVVDVGAKEPTDEELGRRLRAYRCVVLLDGPISASQLDLAVSSLRGRGVRQRIRGREVQGSVRDVACRLVTDRLLECVVVLSERLYVRELFEGRDTEPSFSSLVSQGATCVEFDLLGVYEGAP